MKLLLTVIFSALIVYTPTHAQQAKYVENRFKLPIGPYFAVDQNLYRVKGAEEVKGLGTYGRVTGKGWLGPFVVNGLKANGSLGMAAELETRSATSSGESIVNAMLNGNVSGETPNGDAIVAADGKLSISLDEEYTILVVRPSNWEQVYTLLNSHYKSGGEGAKARFQDPKFRIVDNIVYATNLKIEKITNTVGKIEGDAETSDLGSDSSKIDVNANLEGSGSKTTTFELTGKQIIAYSFRRLCWLGETIVEAREDNPGPSDMSNCNEYKRSP